MQVVERKKLLSNEDLATPSGQPTLSGRPSSTSGITYVAVPRFPETDPRSKLGARPEGSIGDYNVTYVLADPGRNIVQENSDMPTLLAGGDSRLAVGDEVKLLQLATTNMDGTLGGEAIVAINSERRLARVNLVVAARNFDNAEEQAHDLVMPFLSRLAFDHEVAITTSVVYLQEVATGTQRFTVQLLGTTKDLHLTQGPSTPEHRLLLAAYRESLSSMEPLWQALSAYKVIEGVRALRSRRRSVVKASGGIPRDIGERFPKPWPTRGWSAEALRYVDPAQYLGRKFTDVVDGLRGSLRNSAAHLDPDSDALAADHWADSRLVKQAVPVLRYMARVMLASELTESPSDSPLDIAAGDTDP